MTAAFDPPPGDAASLNSAAKTLSQVATDLNTAANQTKGGVATSLADWHGARTDDFRKAGAGIQAQLATELAAVGSVQQAISAYAKALASTAEDVASFKTQAGRIQTDANTASKKLDPDDPQQDKISQHASRQQGLLQTQALDAKSALVRLAHKLAAAIDVETDLAVPGSASLSPDEIRRRVDSSLGVTGLQKAAADGTLTPDQAWKALEAAEKAVPDNAVNADGSIDWKEAMADFNDKFLGPPNAIGGLGTTPSEGWALYRLALNQREVGAVANDLRTAFDEIVGPVALDMDRGLAGFDSLNDALIQFKGLSDAVTALGPSAETAEAIEKAAAGGLPETGVIGVLGKLAGAAAVIGDVMTIIDPGVKNPVEAGGLRAAATANIIGTGMAFAPGLAALVGINAVADWIPVAGQVVMVVSGLILAGDYVYHHWDQISNFVTKTVPHALSVAVDATGHALSVAADATGHALSVAADATGHALSVAADATGHALSTAADATGHAFVSGAKAVGNFFSSVF